VVPTSSPDRESKPQTPAVITLLVSPEEANELAMAATQGRIQLALRNMLDSAKVDPAPVMQAALFGAPQSSAPAPAASGKKIHAPEKSKAAAPPDTYNVEVIRGAKKEETTFPAPAAQ
jgi:Flp pilus assembly protein CpaB